MMRSAMEAWKRRVLRLVEEASADRIDLVAGGVAFYALIALFPMLIAALSIYGLFMSPEGLEAQLEALSGMMPGDSGELVVRQLRAINESPSRGLTYNAIIGTVIALYSASRGTDALIQGIGIAYDEPETRGLVRLKLLSFAVTICLVLGVIVAVLLVAVVPIATSLMGLEGTPQLIANTVRWPLLLALFITGLSTFYRVAPCANRASFRVISWGSLVATALWLLASYGFSLYVTHVADYQATYGSLGGAVVLLLWLWITAYSILLGAEVDAVFHRV